MHHVRWSLRQHHRHVGRQMHAQSRQGSLLRLVMAREPRNRIVGVPAFDIGGVLVTIPRQD